MRFEQLWIKQFTAVGSPLRGNPGILNQPRKKWNFKVTFLNKPWALVRKYFANMMTTAQFLEGSYLRRSNEIHGRNEQNRIKWGVFDCHEMVNMEEVQKTCLDIFKDNVWRIIDSCVAFLNGCDLWEICHVGNFSGGHGWPPRDRDSTNGTFQSMGVPSGKLTKNYWKWPLIVDLTIKNGDFQ